MEPAIAESEGRLRAILETVVDGIITIDEHGIVESMNPAAERIFGYAASDVIGRNVRMLMPEPYRSEHDTYLKNYLHTGQARIIGIGRRVEGLRKDGTVFPLDLAVSETVIRDRRLFTGVVRDITERVRAQEEIARRTEELEQFASVLSHDLRAPLTSIDGCVELLAEELGDHLQGEPAALIGMVRHSVSHMGKLIQKLLEFSLIGRQAIQSVNCDLKRLMEEVLQRLASLLEETGGEVTHDSLPVVAADETLLAQLLQNLIQNALKYHSAEPPCVHLSARSSGGKWVVSVRDNGVGIAPQHFDRVFRMFARINPSPESSGTGIGLAVCKRIVERHGGRMWLESRPGRGTTFFFTLPTA